MGLINKEEAAHHLWISRDANGCYAGKYGYDDKTGEVIGCPAQAPAVEKVMKVIKTKSREKGTSATRQHAEAMTVEELTYIVAWSKSQCSHLLGTRLPASQDTGTIRYHITMHGFMHAFMSTGYTLWTG